MSGVPVETIRQMYNCKIGSGAEEIAENYWRDILKSSESQRFSSLIDRHELNIRTDLLEAETQFWDIFRHGGLENLPKQKGEFQPEVTAYLESLKSYEDLEFYENGENVRPATENLLEQFRERKYTEDASDDQIAVMIINEGLENSDKKVILP